MDKPDMSAIAARMVSATREFVAKAEATLGKRLDELDVKLSGIPAGPKGDKGDAGKDIDPTEVTSAIQAAVALHVAALPAAKQGDPGKQGDIGTRGEKGEAGESVRGEPGPAGKDADPETIKQLVDVAVSALPKPKDGTSVTVDEVAAVVLPNLKQQVAGLKPEKGEKGEAGKDGASVHPDTIALMVREAADKVAATLPKPKDGADGFSLDDFDVSLSDDGRTLSFKFARGEVVKERSIKLETLIYREVWREGEYDKGDVVTWGGSAWHCQQHTEDKPGTSSAWKMMVKEGRAGKDGAAPVAAAREPVRLR